MKAREAERLERLGEYASLYGEALYAREGAKGSLRAFEAIVSGEETDGTLGGWVAALEGVKSAVWGASGDETYARLASLESAWNGAWVMKRPARARRFRSSCAASTRASGRSMKT
jgi:hypothetical protein